MIIENVKTSLIDLKIDTETKFGVEITKIKIWKVKEVNHRDDNTE